MENRNYTIVSKRYLSKYTIVSLGEPKPNSDGCPVVITSFNGDEAEAVYAYNWREVTIDYKDIFPCPIDTYILIRHGFRGYRRGKVVYYFYDAENLNLELTRNPNKRGGWVLVINDQSTLYVSHMHVLQHSVALLTNYFIRMSKGSSTIPPEEYDETLFETIDW